MPIPHVLHIDGGTPPLQAIARDFFYCLFGDTTREFRQTGWRDETADMHRNSAFFPRTCQAIMHVAEHEKFHDRVVSITDPSSPINCHA